MMREIWLTPATIILTMELRTILTTRTTTTTDIHTYTTVNHTWGLITITIITRTYRTIHTHRTHTTPTCRISPTALTSSTVPTSTVHTCTAPIFTALTNTTVR